MSVVIETTLGDITVDLYLEHRPVTCLNFLKLCKMKYYNFNLFHSIRSGFIAQTGDPTGTGSGGQSVFGILGGPQKRFFSGEKMPKIRHTDTGLLSMVCTDDMMVGSQFFFTLAPDLDSLDGVHCVIGEVTEGHEVLRKLNDVICDETHRPYRDVRITHTVILEDPFNDPAGYRAPSRSPSPSAERLVGGRIAPDEEIDETKGKSVAEVHEMLEEKEAKARATILEIIGDLPDADIAPPENVLFVCKLNPVTTDEDLEIIFSRFGKIVSCEVIRDKKTGDSLQYAFIEFSDKKSCEDAYFKMDNVLIDDRRIHVDFSQSVSKMRWLGKGRGVQHIGEEDLRSSNNTHNDTPNEVRDNEKKYRNGKDYDNNREGRKSYDDRRYTDREKHYSKHERSKISSNNKERSRSKPRRDKNQEEAKDNKHKSNKNTQYNEELNKQKHNSSKEKSSRRNEDSYHSSYKDKYSESQDIEKLRHFPQKSNKKNYERRSHGNSSTEESSRRKEDSKQLSYRDKYSESQNIERSRHFSEKNNEKNYERRNHRSYRDTENNKRNLKYKHKEKQNPNVVNVEPRTPSPVLDKKEKKLKSNEVKKSRESRKKRKPSTSSSDSDSSESSSSSSSQSTSSVEENRKKKVIKTRKRKYSSSSSSSSSTSSTDSSSSSTTSSSSSSSSTSSDGNTNKTKRHKKNTSKKELYKPKEKA